MTLKCHLKVVAIINQSINQIRSITSYIRQLRPITDRHYKNRNKEEQSKKLRLHKQTGKKTIQYDGLSMYRVGQKWHSLCLTP